MSHDVSVPKSAPVVSGVLEAALYVDDLIAAKAFYGGVLGLEEIVSVEGRHVFYRCGATIILVFNAAATRIPTSNPELPVPPHGTEGEGHICLAATADELDAWRTHLQSAGIAVEADFLWPNGARSIYVRDPHGNSIEFAEPKLWPPGG